MKSKFSLYKVIWLALVCVLAGACDKDEELITTCEHKLYFVSSAVCSEWSTAAAVKDEHGTLYLARNLFHYIDRIDVTVELEFSVDYSLVDEPADRSQCGVLLVAPIISLSCFELLD